MSNTANEKYFLEQFSKAKKFYQDSGSSALAGFLSGLCYDDKFKVMEINTILSAAQRLKKSKR